MNYTKDNLFQLIALVILTFTFSATSYAEITNLSSAINKAGRQRMLSQRIVATYCQVGMDIKIKHSKIQLSDAIALFDEQLKELKQFRANGPISKQLEKVTRLWLPVRKIVSQPVTRTKAEDLRNQAEDVLRASHRVVIMLQDESGTTTGRMVNVAGRQRMLSQRMSNLYMLKSWDFTSSEYSFDYNTAINEFKGALSELASSSVNTTQINNGLIKAKKQFAILERSLNSNPGEYIPLMVKRSSDKLLAIMNDVTHMYEQVAVN